MQKEPQTGADTIRLRLLSYNTGGFVLDCVRGGRLLLGPGLHSAHTAVDGGAQGMEFLLIICHDTLDAVLVEVPGDLGQGKPHLGELKQGPLEQVVVVCFELDLASLLQHTAVAPQEIHVGKAAAGVLDRRPGVAEIDKDKIHLAGGEILVQCGGITVDEEHVGEAQGLTALHGDDHGVGHSLYGDIQVIRVGGGRLGGEAALAAAQLQIQSGGVGLALPPAALFLFRLLHPQRATRLHPGNQVFLLAHSHFPHLICFRNIVP